MHKKKFKPYDRGTLARLKREGRCFEPFHGKELKRLAEDLAHLGETAALRQTLVNELTDRIGRMVDPALAEEESKTARSEGYAEGLKDKKEEMKAEKVCHDPFHKFFDGKRPMPLMLSEIFNVYFAMRASVPIGGAPELVVLVPHGIDPKKKQDLGPDAALWLNKSR